MYGDPFVADVDNTVASTLHTNTFDLTMPASPTSGSIYKNAVADDGSKVEYMKISHQSVGKGASARDRHLVRFEVSSVNADSDIGTNNPAVGYVVFDIPRADVAANAAATLARQIVGFLRNCNTDETPVYATACNLQKLLNGES